MRLVTLTTEEEGIGIATGCWLGGSARHDRHAVVRRRQLHQRAGAAGRLPGALPDAGDDARPVGRVQSLAGADGPGHAAGAGGRGRQMLPGRQARRGRRDVRRRRRPRLQQPRQRGRAGQPAHHRRQGVRTEMSATSNKIPRRPFMADLLAHRGNALIVPGLGSPTWDCFAAGDSPEYLYSWGGMGLARADGAGRGAGAARPPRGVRHRRRRDADGHRLAGRGRRPGAQEPRHPRARQREVRRDRAPARPHRQPHRHRRRRQGLRHRQTMTVTEQGAVGELARFPVQDAGPVLAVAKIAITEDPWALPEKDGATIAHRFRAALGVGAARQHEGS